MGINGKRTEKEYRAVLMDSSSSLKEFSMDRKKYYKRYLLGEFVEEEDNKAVTMGKLVETLLLEPHEFDNRFALSVCLSTPTGLMLAFVESLYKHTAAATKDGEITRDFDAMCQDAYTDSGFKITFDAVMKKFIGSDAEIYYKEIREVRSKNLTVVTADEISTAERIVETLKTNPVTAEVVNLVDSPNYSVYNQLQVEGYSVEGHLFKSMMDKCIVDHKEKTIQVYDLKCVWAVERFYEEYYLYRRAYIQAYLYWQAGFMLKELQGLSDYLVQPPRFMVCDSTNYFNPLIYTLNVEDLTDALNGFEHKGRKYPGVKEIIVNLKWAVENDIWNMSKDNYLANGLVNIKS